MKRDSLFFELFRDLPRVRSLKLATPFRRRVIQFIETVILH